MNSQKMSISLPGCRISQINTDGPRIYILAITENQKAKCPNCQWISNSIHGYYQRQLFDLPISDYQVILCLRVRRFRCGNHHCARKTFSQSLSQLCQRYQRTTHRLRTALYHIGQSLGGQAGARLASKLNMSTSGKTLVRIVRQVPNTSDVRPRIVGVDDWALRKGHVYGTIVVDLEKREVIDLLPERTADCLANWLRQHPSIIIVTRDRSKEYATGIEAGAPQAIQIADRWHLLKNLRDTLDSCLDEQYPKLKKRLKIYQQHGSSRETTLREAFIRGEPDKIAKQARRTQQIYRYELVQYLKQKGVSIRRISRMFSMHRATVTRYYKAESFPGTKHHKMKPSILDPYLSYLEQRVQEGYMNSSQLWREIVSQGYPGSRSQVSKWMTWRRRQPQRDNLLRPSPETITPILQLPSAKKLAQLLFLQQDILDDEQVWLLLRLKKIPEINTIHDLIHRFIAMVKERKQEQFDDWLGDCLSSDIAAFKRFAQSLTQDYAAVNAALEYVWSNGQTEGQINRLKYLKRQMYGRAHLDLLKQRIMYSS